MKEFFLLMLKFISAPIAIVVIYLLVRLGEHILAGRNKKDGDT